MTTTPLPPLPDTRVVGYYTSVQMQAYATQARADLEAQLKQLGNVFGHLGTADECGNEWIRLQDENQRLREALDSLAERFSNMDANGDKWISTVAAAAMTLRALEKQP